MVQKSKQTNKHSSYLFCSWISSCWLVYICYLPLICASCLIFSHVVHCLIIVQSSSIFVLYSISSIEHFIFFFLLCSMVKGVCFTLISFVYKHCDLVSLFSVFLCEINSVILSCGNVILIVNLLYAYILSIFALISKILFYCYYNNYLLGTLFPA